MTVRKYRSIQDMPGPARRPALDPENLRMAFGLSALAAGLSPLLYEPGVRKFRSWEAAIESRAQRVRKNRGRLAVRPQSDPSS